MCPTAGSGPAPTAGCTWTSWRERRDTDTYQKITVTCDQNVSDERTATIYLHGCGEENVAIAIKQENGIFEWKPFDNGQRFGVSGLLKLNAESEASLRIPYIKAVGTEKYTVSVTQTGGNGLTAAAGSYSISSPGNGFIEIPLHGHRDQTGHRDLRAESHRRRGRRNGLRRDFDHRPRRIRPSGRRDAAAGPELQQIPVGRRLHRPESRRDLGGQDRRQPQPRQRDGERHGGHQRQHRRHHLDRTQRQSLVLPRHRHGGLDGLPQLHVPRLHAVRSGERQRRRTARQHHLPGAEHSRGLRHAADLQGRHLGRRARSGHGRHLREERRLLDFERHAQQDRRFDQELRFARHPGLHVGRSVGRHPQPRIAGQSVALHLHGRQLVLRIRR